MSPASADASPHASRLPRWSLALVTALHAMLFAWAALKLPWSQASTFTIVLLGLALAHVATGVAALLRSRALSWIWRITSLVSLGVLAWLGWELARSATYLGVLYGSLGEGIGAILLAVIGLAALPTLPFACWGLAATWDPRWIRSLGLGAGVVTLLVAAGLWGEARASSARPLPSPPRDTLSEDLAGALPVWADLPAAPRARGRERGKSVPSLYTIDPVACVPDPESGLALAVVTYMVASGTPGASDSIALERGEPNAAFRDQLERRGTLAMHARTRCVWAEPDALVEAIADLLAKEALRERVVIDVVDGIGPLRSRGAILDMLALRPGLDGVCDEQACLMPWQLLAANQFVRNEPLPWVPDLRLGLSRIRLRQALGQAVPSEVLEYDDRVRRPDPKADPLPAAPDDQDEWDTFDGLSRVTTQSFTITLDGRLVPLVRMRERDFELTAERLRGAQQAAESNIAGSQLEDGRFRYLLDPFTGTANDKSWNLPRQAGTTLVVCEHGQNPKRTAAVAQRSAAFMARHARVSEANGRTLMPLSRRKDRASLGSTALPGLAMLTCRERGRIDAEFDATLIGMVEFLLAMQRPDGSFYPDWDVAAGQPIDGPEPMYAGGQAIYALSMAEKLGDPSEPGHIVGLPDPSELHAAIEAAIAYYTGPYWDTFVRDFFWLEENWHCLAARASLGHHRSAAYEQYCLDYVSYKSRIPLSEHSRVADEFIGAYALGNVLVPVNTPAAGHGEALAAAMAIKSAQGLDTQADRAQMRELIAFLVRQQWHPDTCFACTSDHPVVGGFSESMGAPEVRIDYTQHAWAALGHGGALIIDELP